MVEGVFLPLERAGGDFLPTCPPRRSSDSDPWKWESDGSALEPTTTVGGLVHTCSRVTRATPGGNSAAIVVRRCEVWTGPTVCQMCWIREEQMITYNKKYAIHTGFGFENSTFFVDLVCPQVRHECHWWVTRNQKHTMFSQMTCAKKLTVYENKFKENIDCA